jgi:hypothetical protein
LGACLATNSGMLSPLKTLHMRKTSPLNSCIQKIPKIRVWIQITFGHIA